MVARTRKRARDVVGTDDVAIDARESSAQGAIPQGAIPGLPEEIVVAHILGSANLPDAADLAHLKAVSRAMRDAVAATGLQFKELHEWEAMDLGCLSALQRLQRRGRLAEESLCSSAATFGQLEVLQWAREIRCPWDEATGCPLYPSDAADE